MGQRKRRSVRRNLEATVGMPLLEFLGGIDMKSSGLVGPKQVYLPKCGVTMNYYEREAVAPVADDENTAPSSSSTTNTPTLLFCRGIGSSAGEFPALIRLLKVPKNVRILVPEHIGHGTDLKRAKEDPDFDLKLPSRDLLVNSTSEFLDEVKVGTNCNALGTSLGGALLYYLKCKRPDVIQKTVLVCPALLNCLQDPFVDGIRDGTYNFLDFQSRDDVKRMFRTHLWTGKKDGAKKDGTKKRSKKDPIPKLFYEVLFRLNQRDVPEGHFRALQEKLLNGDGPSTSNTGFDEANGNDSTEEDKSASFTATVDVDPDSDRLVVWGEEDQITSYDKGKVFFANSPHTTLRGIPNCGHTFASNGDSLYVLVPPLVHDFVLDFSDGESPTPQQKRASEAAIC